MIEPVDLSQVTLQYLLTLLWKERPVRVRMLSDREQLIWWMDNARAVFQKVADEAKGLENA